MRRLLIGAAWLYSAIIVVFAGLWQFAPMRWWVILTNVFAPLFFVPLLLLVPAALLVRSAWLRVLALPLLIFVLLFGDRFIPKRMPEVAEGTPLRVATFNHLYDNSDIHAVIATISAQQADVVALQELSPAVAAAARQQLGELFPYQLLDSSAGVGGLGLLSRYPLKPKQPLDGTRNQRATITVGGQAIMLVNVHVHREGVTWVRMQRFPSVWLVRGFDADVRLAQVQTLLDQLSRVSGPMIVLGDFNTGDREPGYAAMAAQLHDAYRATNWGFGFTFPTHRQIGAVTVPLPVVRIDYVWTNEDVTPLATRVVCADNGSDHCMVVADVKVLARNARR